MLLVLYCTTGRVDRDVPVRVTGDVPRFVLLGMSKFVLLVLCHGSCCS